MYELFKLEGRNINIQGYHFPCENPNHVVVLIHGIGEHAGRYDRVSEFFREGGIAMVGMDLRGHGRTEGKRGDCAPRDEVLKDIDCLIEYAKKLYPKVPVVIYGHSMGGNIVLDYRARGKYNDIPEKYLVSGPWIKLVRPVKGILLGIITVMNKIAPFLTFKSNCPEEDLGNIEYVRPYREDPLVHPYVSMRTANDGYCVGKLLEESKNEDNGKAHSIPTLIMHGDKDKICDIDGTRNFVSSHRVILEGEDCLDKLDFIEWQGYYHEIHNGGPNGETGEEPIKKMIDFIRETL